MAVYVCVCVFLSFANSITLIWCESRVLVFYFIEYVFTDKRVQAVIQTGSKCIPLAACFYPPLLSKDDLQLKAFMEQLTIFILGVIDMVKEHTDHWSESNEHKVCVALCVCVCMQCFTVLI